MSSRARPTSVKKAAAEIFARLGLAEHNSGVFAGQWLGSGPVIEKASPIDGSLLARATTATQADVARVVGAAPGHHP